MSTPQARDQDTADEAPEESFMQQLLGDFSPKFVALTNQVLDGDVWTRPELSGRDRSIVTVSAFAAGGDAANVDGYLHFARANGLTEDELVEPLTHLAFYGGWPQTVTATAIAKAIFDN